MKLGVFTVSIPEWEPVEALEKLSGMGYDGVEWRVFDDQGDRANPSFWGGNRTSMTAGEIIERADELKAAAARFGMEMPSLGAYDASDNLPAVEQNIKAAAAIGARNVRILTPRYDPAEGYFAQVDRVRGQFAEAAAIAADHDVRVVIETHMGQLGPSTFKARGLIEGLDPACAGIMWDIGNQTVEGSETLAMAMDIAGEYLAEVHVKNMAYRESETVDGQLTWKAAAVPVHQGLVNWPAAIAQLKAGGFDGWLFFEDFSTDLPMADRVEKNAQWFRELIG